MKTTNPEHVLLMFCACNFHGNSMNNFLSYCGLVDARISVSDKYLPVHENKTHHSNQDLIFYFSHDKLCMPEDKVSV